MNRLIILIGKSNESRKTVRIKTDFIPPLRKKSSKKDSAKKKSMLF
jgi:hypothetical protein